MFDHLLELLYAQAHLHDIRFWNGLQIVAEDWPRSEIFISNLGQVVDPLGLILTEQLLSEVQRCSLI